MTRIEDTDPREMRQLERDVQKVTRGSASLEEAVQRYTGLIRERFADDVVLARVFVTLPYRDLPPTNRGFVDELARAKGVEGKMGPDVLTLSLLGTSGVEPDWNDRRRSRGHVGIPLVSSAFVAAIPMIARLLHELGLGFDWLDTADADLVVKTLGSINGVFHVADAVSATDAQGRKIIPAQDFVATHGVRSVIGVGGAYIGYPIILVAVLFCSADITRARAEEFMAHINRIKASTMDLVHQGKIFTAEPESAQAD
jgi:hypothetical protein